jgi:hypothetical protein
MPSAKRTPSPKAKVKIRGLAVGDRARIPSRFLRVGGEGDRRYATFYLPAWHTGRLTILLAFAPDVEELEEGAPYPLGCRITRLDDNKAAVEVHGAPARTLVSLDKLEPAD